MQTLKLTEQQELFLQSFGNKVKDKYYYIPHWFRKDGEGVYTELDWDDLLEDLKQAIQDNRGIKKEDRPTLSIPSEDVDYFNKIWKKKEKKFYQQLWSYLKL